MTRVIPNDALTHALLKDRFAREQASQIQAYQRRKREEASKVKDGHKVTKVELKRQQLERLRADIAAAASYPPDMPPDDPYRYRIRRFQPGAIMTTYQNTGCKAAEKGQKVKAGSASPPPPPLSGQGEGQWQKYMKPVEETTSCLLYDGVSGQGKGRKSYLKARNDLDPEQKYYLPLISSWEYGWRVGSWMSTRKCSRPEHCFTTTIPETFYRRNGIPLTESQE